MSETTGYRSLIVWQKAMDLIPEIYGVIKLLPKEERFAMAEQMRRAAVSIVANIAEGHGRTSRKEFAYFLSVSRGSLAEVDSLVAIAIRLNYFPVEIGKPALERIAEVRKLLFGLSNKLLAAS